MPLVVTRAPAAAAAPQLLTHHRLCVLRTTTSSSSSTANAGEEPKTNFVSDKPSSWYSELYQRDQLTGGHVIMLGADDDSRCECVWRAQHQDSSSSSSSSSRAPCSRAD
jgi:hypothetical protein